VSRLAADEPAHRRIMTQAFGVVHVLVSGEAAALVRDLLRGGFVTSQHNVVLVGDQRPAPPVNTDQTF
jgi:hypothetical protein